MDLANHKSTIVIVVLALMSTLQAITIAAMSNGWKPWASFAAETAQKAADQAVAQATTAPIIRFQTLVPEDESKEISVQQCTDAAIKTFGDFGIRPKALQSSSFSEAREAIKIRFVCTDSNIGAIYIVFAYPSTSFKSAQAFSARFVVYLERNLNTKLKQRAF
jgi:hypothetical protein